MLNWKYDKRKAKTLASEYGKAVLEQIVAQTELQMYTSTRDMSVGNRQVEMNVRILQRRVTLKGDKVIEAFKAMAECVGYKLDQPPAQPAETADTLSADDADSDDDDDGDDEALI